jgi:hypothetical protein
MRMYVRATRDHEEIQSGHDALGIGREPLTSEGSPHFVTRLLGKYLTFGLPSNRVGVYL